MENWLKRFKELESEINNHPLLEITKSVYNKGLMDENLDLVEKMENILLPPEVRHFYKQANGLQISWKFKESIGQDDYANIAEMYNDYDYFLYYDGERSQLKDVIGNVNILRIEHCFLDDYRERYFDDSEDNDWTLNFFGKDYPGNSFGKELRPFDLIDDYYCTAFVLCRNFEVMLLSNYYIAWDISRLINFNTYLELVLQTKGIIDGRHEVMHELLGHNLPILELSQEELKKQNPKLFW